MRYFSNTALRAMFQQYTLSAGDAGTLRMW